MSAARGSGQMPAWAEVLRDSINQRFDDIERRLTDQDRVNAQTLQQATLTNGRVTELERERAERRAVQEDHAARETQDRQRAAWFWPMLVGGSIALATLIVFLIAYHLI